VDFSIVLPKGHPDYKTENQLFREMLRRFKPPTWAKRVIVTADAAFASIDNMQLVKELDRSDPNRRWGFVFAMARTWKMEDDKSLSDLVKHTPYKCFQRTWIPRMANEKGRKTFWVFRKRTRLRHIGDVTMVLSKKGRNVGPKNTKVLVTNLVEMTARQVLLVYQRRWTIEILFKELKSGLGLGEHQVTKEVDRIEKSIGVAIIAYLVLIRARKRDIRPGQSWSIFQLKSNFTNDLICNQFQHNLRRKLDKLMKAA
jgi:IS4 transposase